MPRDLGGIERKLVGLGPKWGAKADCQRTASPPALMHTLGSQSGPLDTHAWVAARPYAAEKQDYIFFWGFGSVWLALYQVLKLVVREQCGH